MIESKISEDEVGIWMGFMFILKNYMVFFNVLLMLYVFLKFVGIYIKFDFMKELGSIYKILFLFFVVGMFLVYIFRDIVIDLIFKDDYSVMFFLFKW